MSRFGNPLIRQAPKRHELAMRRKQVSVFFSQRYRLNEIADLMGISPSTVAADIKYLEKLWEKDGLSNIESTKVRELHDLDKMEQECIRRLDLCTKPWQGARWMEERRKIKKRRAELMGLDAPKNIRHTHKDRTLNKEQRDAAFNAMFGISKPRELLDEDVFEATDIIINEANGEDFES